MQTPKIKLRTCKIKVCTFHLINTIINVLIYCGQLDNIWNNYHVQEPPLNIRVSFEHLTVFTSILIKSCIVCTQSEHTSIPEKRCTLYFRVHNVPHNKYTLKNK